MGVGHFYFLWRIPKKELMAKYRWPHNVHTYVCVFKQWYIFSVEMANNIYIYLLIECYSKLMCGHQYPRGLPSTCSFACKCQHRTVQFAHSTAVSFHSLLNMLGFWKLSTSGCIPLHNKSVLLKFHLLCWGPQYLWKVCEVCHRRTILLPARQSSAHKVWQGVYSAPFDLSDLSPHLQWRAPFIILPFKGNWLQYWGGSLWQVPG